MLINDELTKSTFLLNTTSMSQATKSQTPHYNNNQLKQFKQIAQKSRLPLFK